MHEQLSTRSTPGQGLTRRKLLRYMGGASIALAATACAIGTGGDDGDGTTTAAEGQNGNGTSRESIRYWTWMASYEEGNVRSQSQGRILDAFREANPDVDVVEEIVPWNELQPQLLQAVAGGRAPDVCRQLDQDIATLAQAEALTPLNEFTNDWDEARRQDFIYDWEDTAVGGQKFAFRQSLRVANLMFYRPSLFAEAGFDEVPLTLDGFTEAAQAVTQGPVHGFLMPFSRADSLNRFMQTCPSLYWALGSDLVDIETGEPTFHEDAGQRIFQWFQDLVYEHEVSPQGQATMDSEQANQTFQGGNLAATWHHSSQWAEWAEIIPEGDLATTTMPNPAGGGDPIPASTEGGWTLCMPAGANKDAAWRLIEFFHSEEAELIDAEVAGELPTRASVLEDPFFQTDEFARQREWLEYVNEHAHPATSIKIPNRPAFAEILGDAAQRIIAGQADVASTLEEAAERYAAER